ncbi:Deleted in malignant brain tumors 1 protein [Mytilus edulis]|uniref:Deleted in malignant brain tumors 1 protein n=1 Tax=Mytilus edulis TaxID=6550 RepID=A0A8S3S855_MYTED|nr:Deleted in malignant brain tumors 1 protein [Mytilus edulis]
MLVKIHFACLTLLNIIVPAQRLGIYTLAGKNHTALQGRVEIRINGTSGTVCDDKFDNNAATVVCRVLNHNNGGIAVLDHRFGPGTGPIWLDDLVCQGNEQYLNQCQTNSKYLNASNCNHKEDVGVICNIDSRSMQISNSSITSQIIQQPSNCPNYRTNLDVRLIGPLNLIGIGYVEIKHNGVWGSICDDLWSLNDAKVICRMLCFELYCVQAGGPKEMIAGINQVSTNYLLDDVECTGNELDIRDCKRLNWSIHNCRPEHQEFASVTCIPLKNERPPVPVPTMECTNGTFNVQFSRYQDRFLLTEHLSVKNNSRLCTLTKAINSSTVSIIIPFTEECGSHASVAQSVTFSTSADMTSATSFTSLLSSKKVIDRTTSNIKTVTSTSSITSLIINTNSKQEGSENGFATTTSTASRAFDKSKTTFQPTFKLSEHNQRDTTITATTVFVEKREHKKENNVISCNVIWSNA